MKNREFICTCTRAPARGVPRAIIRSAAACAGGGVLRRGCCLYWETGLAGLLPLPAVYTTAVLVTGLYTYLGQRPVKCLENREFRFDRAVLCYDPVALEFALGCIPTTHLALRVNSPTHTTHRCTAHETWRDEGYLFDLAVALP